MNKTININLAGVIFHLEEPAYESFKAYFKQVKDALLNQEGGAEIVADIEARIAEIFNLRLQESNSQVIMESDVDFVISTLGRPEDFTDESEEGEYNGASKTKRRFFRNPDEKVIGGVASGIGSYFKIDPVFIRILFLIMLFFTGIGFLTYVILWIAIPEAKTTAQKLQMRGEPVNLGNIEKSVKEELEGVKERFGRFRENQKETGSLSSAFNRFLNFLLNIVEAVFNFVIRFLGLILIVIGSIIAFSLLITILGIAGSTWNLGGMDFMVDGNLLGMNSAEAVLGLGWRLTLLKVGTLLTLVLPVVTIISLIVRILGKKVPNGKILNVTAGITFAAGLIMIIYAGGSVAREFTDSATEVQEIKLTGSTFDLRADLLEDDENFLFEVQDDQLRIENVSLDIRRTFDSTATLVLKHKAHGKNHAQARTRAKQFNYPVESTGTILSVSEYFGVPKEALYRGQRLKATLYIPDGTRVFLDPSIENIIYDIENVYNMWDGDMLGHTWEMQKRGLVCIDCQEHEYYRADELGEINEDLEDLESDIEEKLEELELELKRLKDK